MKKRRARTASVLSGGLESLEDRLVLSTVSAKPVHDAPTQTTVAVGSGTLGQPITFHVTVRASASAGSPQGTVKITDNGTLIESLPLSPTSTAGKTAISGASVTVTPQPGGSADFFGKHAVNATFIPANGRFSASAANKSFTVGHPAYTSLANGVKIATIVPGSGAPIQSGQTASVLYTGYLASTGQIFDDSINDGGPPFSFQLGSGQVIPGFDAGTVGMKVGETRIVSIPATQGYGSQSNGAIPPNSNLIFVLTLESIS